MGNPVADAGKVGDYRYYFMCLFWLFAGGGVPVAGVPKTTIRTFPVNREDENEGLRLHIQWTKTPDFVHA